MAQPREQSLQTQRPIKRRFSLMTATPDRRTNGRAAVLDSVTTRDRVGHSLLPASATEEEVRASLTAELRQQTEPVIASLSTEIEILRTELTRAGVRADESFRHIQGLIGELVERLQHVARTQQAPPIEKIGLERALERYCQQMCDHASLEVAYESQINERAINPEAALAAFRIAQDALSHAAKHRRPNFVSVKIAQEGSHLHLRVEDMGEEPPMPNPAAEAAERNFLDRMQERASQCDGRLQISRGPRATLLALQLPLISPRSACAV